jgi:ATP-dependent Clp protease adaptor protein ClpS
MKSYPPHAADNTTAPRVRVTPKLARPPLYKVILLNDDFTPREFVVRVLKAEFRITGDQAQRIMITAHTKGSCVVAVFTREVAETKATRATEMARSEGFPLLFSTEPEE